MAVPWRYVLRRLVLGPPAPRPFTSDYRTEVETSVGVVEAILSADGWATLSLLADQPDPPLTDEAHGPADDRWALAYLFSQLGVPDEEAIRVSATLCAARERGVG